MEAYTEYIQFLEKGNQYRRVYSKDVAKSLQSCQEYGRVIFMPEIVDTRISADKASTIWEIWGTTPSIRVTGRTKQGNPVVVYAHIDNYLSNPENIRKVQKNLVDGAGIIPRDEFQRLLDLEDNEKSFVIDYWNNNVLVFDYDDHPENSYSEIMPVEKALGYPQTIPYLGGEERAKRYLEKFKEFYNYKKKIMIGIRYNDDLKDVPLGRLLGFNAYGHYEGSLNECCDFNYDANFVGVCNNIGVKGATQRTLGSSLK